MTVKAKVETHELNLIYKTSLTTIIFNFLLALLKLFTGIFAFSRALISDAIHSLSDVFSTIIVMVGAGIAKKEADKDHPYGHEKFESIASLILAMILIFTALTLGYSGILSLIAYFSGDLAIVKPTLLALIVAFISIVVKEWMFWYTKLKAKKAHSTSMLADAWHHRSDALSSVGSLIGIGLAMLGYLYFDSLASIVISLIVFKVGVTILIQAVNQVVDKAPNPETIDEIKRFILSQSGVITIDVLHIRMHVDKLYVDVEIAVLAHLSLIEAHKIAERVHHNIEGEFPDVKHCMVHVNPKKESLNE